MTARSCKDCLAELVARPIAKLRPAPYPGPRCATHHRVEGLRRKKAAQEKRRQDVYGLGPDEHAALLALQGGACAICQRAKGTTRALAVDHDHSCTEGHPTDRGCRECVRGLLCKPCNRMLGHLRDDPETARRAADYLRHPPYKDLRRSNGTRSARSASGRAGTGSVSRGSNAAGAPGTASSGFRT